MGVAVGVGANGVGVAVGVGVNGVAVGVAVGGIGVADAALGMITVTGNESLYTFLPVALLIRLLTALTT